MKKLLLFRNATEEYENVFKGKYDIVFLEPLQFNFINTQEMNDKVMQNTYDGLLLTSPRAIEALSKNWTPSKLVMWNSKKIYTVGNSSSHKIKQLLGLEAMGMGAGNAEHLANIIVNENQTKSKFLFPCGTLSSETVPAVLHKHGLTVDSITVYETNENNNLQANLMRISKDSTLAEDSPCGLVFFSPSGCEYVHQQLQTFSNKLASLPHFAIGKTTAHKIQTLGLEVAGVADKPQAQSLMEAIHTFFSSPSS